MKHLPFDDLMVRAVPTPRERNSVLVLRVRAKNYIPAAAVFVSSDGQSYTQIHDSVGHVVGGRLAEAMPQDGSVTIRLEGPDLGPFRVLSEEDWKLGRQVMVVGDEWCFVRQVEPVGRSLVRVHGCLRGRFDSPIQDHQKGTEAFLADCRWLLPLRDPAVRLGTRLWVKTQPVASKPLQLAAARAWPFDLKKPRESRHGRGEAPLAAKDGTYLLASIPAPGTLQLFRTGLLLRGRGDYRLDGDRILLSSPLAEGDWLMAWYTPEEA